MGYINKILIIGMLIFSACNEGVQDVNNDVVTTAKSDSLVEESSSVKEILEDESSGTPVEADSVYNLIGGKWKYVKHLWWKQSKFGNKEMDSIKASVLTIEKHKIFFQSSNVIEPCSYTNVEIKNFFDREEKEADPWLDGPIANYYSKEELSNLIWLEFNCEYDCLGSLFVKQDTLIISNCGGATYFMTRVLNPASLNSSKDNFAK